MQGRVMPDGTDMGRIDARDLRRPIGYLGQDVRLFTGTLKENLNLNLLERNDDRLMRALDFAGPVPFVRAHTKGLDLDIRDGGQGLSRGQRQSVGRAGLRFQDAKMCLLDEATAALGQTLERTLIPQNGRMAVDGPRDQILAHLAQSAQQTA